MGTISSKQIVKQPFNILLMIIDTILIYTQMITRHSFPKRYTTLKQRRQHVTAGSKYKNLSLV